MTAPRDWDKELAQIDNIIAKGGSAPPVAGTSAPSPARRDAGPSAASVGGGSLPLTRPRDTAVVWAKAIFSTLGAIGLLVWPYSRTCGIWLYAYLLGTAAVVGAGIWTMRAAWVHRRGMAHIVGLIVLLAGLALAAAEVLPRTIIPSTLTWNCS